jgi:hypothetical protein
MLDLKDDIGLQYYISALVCEPFSVFSRGPESADESRNQSPMVTSIIDSTS